MGSKAEADAERRMNHPASLRLPSDLWKSSEGSRCLPPWGGPGNALGAGRRTRGSWHDFSAVTSFLNTNVTFSLTRSHPTDKEL
jgi:hypothetical protein